MTDDARTPHRRDDENRTAEIRSATRQSPRLPPRTTRTGARVFAAQVSEVAEISLHMRRLTVTAPELADYQPAGPDEYLGLMFPRDDTTPLQLPSEGDSNIRAAVAAIPDAQRPDLRWYSLRAHRPERCEIDIDFVVHGDEGPGTRFARRAAVGSVVGIRECTALYAATPEDRVRVIIGDETAIPAISRILEETEPIDSRIFIEVGDTDDLPELPAAIEWIHRDGQPAGTRLVAAVAAAELPAQVDYAWICGEQNAVRELRRLLVEWGVPKDRITFSAYWRLGEPRL